MVFGLGVVVARRGVRVLFEGQLDGLLHCFPTKNLGLFNFPFHFNIIFARVIAFRLPNKCHPNL
jgi:hypothetical protein